MFLREEKNPNPLQARIVLRTSGGRLCSLRLRRTDASSGHGIRYGVQTLRRKDILNADISGKSVTSSSTEDEA